MTIFSGIFFNTILIVFTFLILLLLVYLFSSFEKGNLEEFRQGSEYKFATLSQGTTAYKDIGDKNDPAIIGKLFDHYFEINAGIGAHKSSA